MYGGDFYQIFSLTLAVDTISLVVFFASAIISSGHVDAHGIGMTYMGVLITFINICD